MGETLAISSSSSAVEVLSQRRISAFPLALFIALIIDFIKTEILRLILIYYIINIIYSRIKIKLMEYEIPIKICSNSNSWQINCKKSA